MAQEICPEGQLNPHDIAAYEPFDQGLTQRYLQARWETFQVDQQRLAMSSDRRSPGWYRDTYLKSTWWTTRRRRALADAGRLCERCRDKKAVHVHHLNYLRLFRERRQDLQALCWDCHRVADGERRRSRPRPNGQLRLLN
jgi:5-methylcytosine-specific restriction endonuclease McrA